MPRASLRLKFTYIYGSTSWYWFLLEHFGMDGFFGKAGANKSNLWVFLRMVLRFAAFAGIRHGMGGDHRLEIFRRWCLIPSGLAVVVFGDEKLFNKSLDWGQKARRSFGCVPSSGGLCSWKTFLDLLCHLVGKYVFVFVFFSFTSFTKPFSLPNICFCHLFILRHHI